jgi:hypothetical protein
MRDVFGRVLAPPDAGHEQRVDLLRALAGELQGAESPRVRWLGGRLATWLRDGGALESALGVRARRGSRATAQALVARDARDAAIARLVAAIGGIAPAVRALRGGIGPASAAEALAEARALGCPVSRRSLSRALARHRR